MRRMLRTLGRKLGVLRPCGTFEFSSPGDPRDGVLTIGGPSYRITEKGIEGPIYPAIWVDWGWIAKAESPPKSGETGSAPPDVEPVARDKPAYGEEEAGAP